MPGDWIKLWLQTLLGSTPRSDPWNDDPRIRAERVGQHRRIDKVTGPSAREQMEDRQRRVDQLQAQVDVYQRQVRRDEDDHGEP